MSSRTEDRRRQRTADLNRTRSRSSRSRSRSRSRDRIRIPRKDVSSMSSTSTSTANEVIKTEIDPSIPTTSTATALKQQQSMAAIVDTPLSQQQQQQQAPSQHIQYNIDEGTLRKFCQPYNMKELVSMISNTAAINSDFYSILVSEMKQSAKWCKLFVHGLPWTSTQETLFNTFSRFGTISECVILKDRNGQSKGYGFINYSNAQEAINAINAGPQQIDGRMVGSDLAWKGRKNGRGTMSHGNNRQSRFGAPATIQQPAQNMNALQARIVPTAQGLMNGAAGPLAMRRLFVYSLLYTTTDDTLHRVFSQYGELEEAVIIKDKSTLKSKGYGFVVFKNVNGANNALKERRKQIDGRTVHCSLAIEGNQRQSHNNNNNNNQQQHVQLQQQQQQQVVTNNMNALQQMAALQQAAAYDPYQQALLNNLSASANASNQTQILQQLLASQIQQQQQQLLSVPNSENAQSNKAPAPINPNYQ